MIHTNWLRDYIGRGNAPVKVYRGYIVTNGETADGPSISVTLQTISDDAVYRDPYSPKIYSLLRPLYGTNMRPLTNCWADSLRWLIHQSDMRPTTFGQGPCHTRLAVRPLAFKIPTRA